MVFKDKEKILKYIDNWIEHVPEYNKYGIIPKLSILIHGNPGVGKSTFTKALADYLNIDEVRLYNVSYFDTNRKEKPRRQNSQRVPFICAIDDIDCICTSRDNSNDSGNNAILSNLLEYLDNPNTFYYTASDGNSYPISIIVATTNYYDKLDPAVVRYGRFDLKIHMDDFNKEEATEFAKLYDLSLEDVLEPDDKNKKGDFKISPAYLQALCINSIDNKLKGNHKNE